MKIIQTPSYIKYASDWKIHPSQPPRDDAIPFLGTVPPNAPADEEEIKRQWRLRGKKKKLVAPPEEIPPLSI
jgi:hypothetical protein